MLPFVTPARRRRAVLLITVAVVGACAGGGPIEPDPAPVITVTGVAEGQSYPGPVTIGIAIDRGSYTATLDGLAFSSGSTVGAPGAHRLSVTAKSGLTTATKDINFTIAAPAGGTLLIRIIDLGANDAGGGGDAILVTDSSAAGQVHALIDAGPAGASAADPGYVGRRLRTLGVDSLRFMLLTHAHSDHFQGMSAVLSDVVVDRFYYNGQLRDLSFYQNVLALARNRADTVIVPADTIAVAFGRSAVQSRFTILTPLPTFLNNASASSDEMNEGSLGVLLRRGSFSMFFAGDGEVAANARWRTQFAALTANIDVLKVGHHGANNAIFDNGFNGTSTWLAHTNPAISVISANGTTHPRINALNQLLSRTNTRTYCTNVHGDITLRVYSDGRVDVQVQKQANADCVPGSQATT